jgi:hypothetical protein
VKLNWGILTDWSEIALDLIPQPVGESIKTPNCPEKVIFAVRLQSATFFALF